MDGLSFRNLYQLGFVARDAERACTRLGERFGIRRFRLLRHSDQITTAHAYVGEIMIEVVQVSEDGPRFLAEHRPESPDAAVFHHHAYRVFEPEEWARLSRAADATGLPVYRQSARDGDLQTMFVDLRSELGLYAEYVHLTGAMVDYYQDVPRN